ncbi:MAG: polysulfide reductase NrfD [Thermodesulfobacterium sp.]|jgi:molybdopterin-containing oxidoreductase family membrane subunit|nr:polysulfide reductase NrfD [Thermodesulfobacterium sp.]
MEKKNNLVAEGIISKDEFKQNWLQFLMEFLSGSKDFYILLVLSGLIVLISAMFGVNAMYVGYSHVYGIYREIPWGILISGYIFFVVISTGLSIISSLGHVFGVKSLIPISKRSVYLSIVTLFTGFMVIFFDLENPFRMAIWNVFSPNLTSNIWWMGTLYGVSLIFVTFEFLLTLLRKYRYAMIFSLLTLIGKVLAISNLGAVFGMLYGRDFWYGPFIPIYLIASAISSGCAAIIFFTYLGYRIRNERFDKSMELALQVVGKLWALSLAILAFLIFWKIVTGIASSEGQWLAIRELMFGKYAVNFWFFEIFLGLITPFFLLFVSKFRNINQMFAASLLSFIGIFFMRVDMVVIGQIVSHFFEYKVTDFPVILTYEPTLHEIMLIIGACAFCVFSFLIGEKVFKGHHTEIH